MQKLKDIAAQRGRPVDDLVQNVMAGYADELAETKAMPDSRYDDIKSGKVKLISGEEALAGCMRGSRRGATAPHE